MRAWRRPVRAARGDDPWDGKASDRRAVGYLRRVVFARREARRIEAKKLWIEKIRVGLDVAVRHRSPYATLKCDEEACVGEHGGATLQA